MLKVENTNLLSYYRDAMLPNRIGHQLFEILSNSILKHGMVFMSFSYDYKVA